MRYSDAMSNAAETSWIPATDSLGARLALVRWRMGWNLKEAERECHLTQNTWGGYEGGRAPRNLIEVVNRIVLRTGVDRMWLLTGEGSPEPNMPPKDYKAAGSLVRVDFATGRRVVS